MSKARVALFAFVLFLSATLAAPLFADDPPQPDDCGVCEILDCRPNGICRCIRDWHCGMEPQTVFDLLRDLVEKKRSRANCGGGVEALSSWPGVD